VVTTQSIIQYFFSPSPLTVGLSGLWGTSSWSRTDSLRLPVGGYRVAVLLVEAVGHSGDEQESSYHIRCCGLGLRLYIGCRPRGFDVVEAFCQRFSKCRRSVDKAANKQCHCKRAGLLFEVNCVEMMCCPSLTRHARWCVYGQ